MDKRFERRSATEEVEGDEEGTEEGSGERGSSVPCSLEEKKDPVQDLLSELRRDLVACKDGYNVSSCSRRNEKDPSEGEEEGSEDFERTKVRVGAKKRLSVVRTLSSEALGLRFDGGRCATQVEEEHVSDDPPSNMRTFQVLGKRVKVCVEKRRRLLMEMNKSKPPLLQYPVALMGIPIKEKIRVGTSSG